MAQKKGGGSTRNGRDSQPKMLGVKAFGGELISAGSITVTYTDYALFQNTAGKGLPSGVNADNLFIVSSGGDVFPFGRRSGGWNSM